MSSERGGKLPLSPPQYATERGRKNAYTTPKRLTNVTQF